MDNDIVLGGFQPTDLDKLIKISENNVIATGNLTQQVSRNTQRIESLETRFESRDDTIAELAERFEKHEQDEELSSKQASKIRTAINAHVGKMLGIKKERNRITFDTKKKSNVYGPLFRSRIYTDLKSRFEVDDYKDIKAIHYHDALEYIRTWTPEGGVETLMGEAEDNWRANNPGQSLEKYLEVLVL